jgi:hypothetical protein
MYIGSNIEPWLGDVPLMELTVGRLRAWQADRIAAHIGVGTIVKARTSPSAPGAGACTSPATSCRTSATRLCACLTRPSCRYSRMPAFALASCARCAGATCARRRSPSSAPPARTGRSRAPRTTSGALCGCSLRSRLTSPSCAPLAAQQTMCSCCHRTVSPLPTPTGRRWPGRRQTGRRGARAAGTARASWRRPRPCSFASLLLAEGRSVHYVARRLGHSLALTLSTYGHLFAEYESADRIDAEREIAQARSVSREACAR